MPKRNSRNEPTFDCRAFRTCNKTCDAICGTTSWTAWPKTKPPASPLVMGPLAKEAGGYGSCGAVFKDTSDPDYKTLLGSIEKGKAELEPPARYGMPGFRPNWQYIREMKRYGILPAGFDAAKDPIDYFQADQAYWRSAWYQEE